MSQTNWNEKWNVKKCETTLFFVDRMHLLSEMENVVNKCELLQCTMTAVDSPA